MKTRESVTEETLPEAGEQNLTTRIYDVLMQAILSGEIAPGQKLSEPAMAREFKASRAPIREAIRRLQERGLVVYSANRGARVARPTAQDFLGLLDVREALEGMAARLAAVHMSAAQIETLKRLVDGHYAGIERDPMGAYMQDDPEMDFHIQIARGGGNPILSSLLCDQFYPRLLLCRRLHRTVSGRGKEAWKEHLAVTEAIAHRDGEFAEILMRRHIRAAKNALSEALGVAAAGKPKAARNAITAA